MGQQNTCKLAQNNIKIQTIHPYTTDKQKNIFSIKQNNIPSTIQSIQYHENNKKQLKNYTATGMDIDQQHKKRKKINPLTYIAPIKYQTYQQTTANNIQANIFTNTLNNQNKNRKRISTSIQFNENDYTFQQIDQILGDIQNCRQKNITEPHAQVQPQTQTQYKQSIALTKQSSYKQMVKVKWNKFIKMKNRNFNEDYKILNQIGRGGFGCVYKVVLKNGQIQRAAKKINKDKLKKDQHQNLLAEMAIMMSLDHPNITKLFQVYDQKNHYIMILQLCQGGQLFDKIVNRMLRQNQSRSIVDQLLNAINYMHKKGIIHRDLKPQNVLFQQNTKLVKIIDFGISARMKPGQYFTARVGTPYYIAPQILNRKYNEKCDIWSLGVIMYMIVYSHPPFKGQDATQVMKNVANQQVLFKNSSKTKFSYLAIDFVKYLLNKNPNARPSAKQALQHPWLRQKKRTSSQCKTRQQVLSRMQKFHFKDKLQAVVHTYIVSQLLSSQQRMQLLGIFRQLDTNNNGIIDSQQIRQALQQKNYQCLDQKKLKKILQYIDTNCSGNIDYTQFLVAGIDFQKKVNQKHFQQAFTYFDIDNSGEITFQEVVQFLQNQGQSRQEIKKIFMKVDMNGDGVISKSQFVELLVGQNSS